MLPGAFSPQLQLAALGVYLLIKGLLSAAPITQPSAGTADENTTQGDKELLLITADNNSE